MKMPALVATHEALCYGLRGSLSFSSRRIHTREVTGSHPQALLFNQLRKLKLDGPVTASLWTPPFHTLRTAHSSERLLSCLCNGTHLRTSQLDLADPLTP